MSILKVSNIKNIKGVNHHISISERAPSVPVAKPFDCWSSFMIFLEATRVKQRHSIYSIAILLYLQYSPCQIGKYVKRKSKYVTQIAKFMGPTWAHLDPVSPRWAPCWPHESCYQGREPLPPNLAFRLRT